MSSCQVTDSKTNIPCGMMIFKTFSLRVHMDPLCSIRILGSKHFIFVQCEYNWGPPVLTKLPCQPMLLFWISVGAQTPQPVTYDRRHGTKRIFHQSYDILHPSIQCPMVHTFLHWAQTDNCSLEYKSLADGATIIVWRKKLLHELKILVKGLILLLGDNHGSIHLTRNLVYHPRTKNKWLKGNDLVKVMARFKDLCGLSSVHGTIDVTQIHLQKVKGENLLQLISIHSSLKVIIYIYIYANNSWSPQEVLKCLC